MSKNHTGHAETVTAVEAPLILIIETSRALREALSRWLEARIPHCRALAMGSTEAAIAMGRASRPSLVLMDMRLAGVSGVEAIRMVRCALPEAPVVVFTHADADIYRETALAAGASGYALKRSAERDLMPLLRHYLGRGDVEPKDEFESTVS